MAPKQPLSSARFIPLATPREFVLPRIPSMKRIAQEHKSMMHQASVYIRPSGSTSPKLPLPTSNTTATTSICVPCGISNASSSSTIRSVNDNSSNNSKDMDPLARVETAEVISMSPLTIHSPRILPAANGVQSGSLAFFTWKNETSLVITLRIVLSLQSGKEVQEHILRPGKVLQLSLPVHRIQRFLYRVGSDAVDEMYVDAFSAFSSLASSATARRKAIIREDTTARFRVGRQWDDDCVVQFLSLTMNDVQQLSDDTGMIRPTLAQVVHNCRLAESTS